MQVKIKRLTATAKLPRYMTDGAAGMDLTSIEEVELWPGTWYLVRTGIAFEIPPGFEGQIRPRSGLAARKGITVLNAPGTIDSDFRGEVGVLLINHSEDPATIGIGDRIAQLVIAPVARVELVEIKELDETARGSGGFGSTGT